MKNEIAYSTMTLAQLFTRYNEEATKRGTPRMKRDDRPDNRGDMGKALALLLAQPRTTKAAPASDGTASDEIRVVVIEELCRIAYFEGFSGRRVEVAKAGKAHHLRSFGFAYSEVLSAVNARLPNAKMTGPKLRVHATNIRNRRPGYTSAKLPDRRKHSTKKG